MKALILTFPLTYIDNHIVASVIVSVIFIYNNRKGIFTEQNPVYIDNDIISINFQRDRGGHAYIKIYTLSYLKNYIMYL